MRKAILSLVLYTMTCASIFAAPNPIRHQIGENYIEQYHQIAIMESLRTGIPASIKLAQGLLESGYGQGNLAMRSNNHFGIKWRSPVDGDYVESYDDETDRNGRKVVSRFIKFNSPEESYQLHSEMLMTRPIYRRLFTYDRSDYRSWAHGLKRAGYASNPKYDIRLIQIIEQYHLDRFDIPTQLNMNDSQQTPSEFYEQKMNVELQKPESNRAPFPTRNEEKAKKETVVINREPKRIVKQEEEDEHILYEVTSESAPKNVRVVKNSVPRQPKK